MYADPDLATQSHPSEISPAMLDQVAQAINQIRWDKEDIANFLGCYLSEPKAHIFFDPPTRPMSLDKFRQAAQKQGVVLDLKCQMLCHANCIFMNGEVHAVDLGQYPKLRELADQRALPDLAGNSDDICHILHQWYLDGYLVMGKKQRG
jgi:50S ribosomal protein L16 3-hydroxylase